MGPIETSSDSSINTVQGHVFFACFDLNGTNRSLPYEFKATNNDDVYTFGSNAPQQNRHLTLLNVRSTAINAKIRNYVPNRIHVWFDNYQGGLFQGFLELGGEYTVNTYEGHVFYCTNEQKTIEYARFLMTQDQVLYIVKDNKNPPPIHILEHRQKEEVFLKEYLNKTAIPWRHYYGANGPRPGPIHHMWPANRIGDVHEVESSEGHWVCKGIKAICQLRRAAQLKLEVVSTSPRVFIIQKFLSDFEVNEIIALAKPKIADSTVGQQDGGGTRKSETRTSQNAWIPRSSSVITNTLFTRAEHLLNITKLDRSNSEDIQVVHYDVGQKYDSHHDWGVSGYPESRFITLLLYLSDMSNEDAGGETAFPKAANGMGFKVHPGKGSAVLFYNLLEDGNGDDLALHAALPVRQGEKWLANFWVWDPKRKN